MYLTDKEIRGLLPQIRIETDNLDHPFSADDQIQPCSIDLRLSNVFWLPAKRKSKIDLRRSKLLEVSPRHHWRRVELKPTESKTIQPGEILLGRTYERFTIPPTCAGKIEGRSSFARMGLSVHCTGGFINPGWRGHMPLQLVNLGPYPIKVFPYLPLSQLMLIRLTSTPERVYGDQEMQSKYMEDDGGPSYWWRDKRITHLQTLLEQSDVSLAIQNDVLKLIAVQEPEIFERFENFVDNRTIGNFENAETLLDIFSSAEDRKRVMDKLLRFACAVPLMLTGAYSLKLAFEPPHPLFHYIIWGAAVLSLLLAGWAIMRKDGEYLGDKELRKLRSPR